MLPTANDIARVIVACARATGENPLDVESRPGLRFRIYAFLVLAIEYPDAPRDGNKADSVRQWVGATRGFANTVRSHFRNPTWFDMAVLNAIREGLDLSPVTAPMCLESTYEPDRGRQGIRRRPERDEAVHAPFTVAAEAIPRATELALVRRQTSAIIAPPGEALFDLDRIPSRQEQLAGHEMIVRRGDDEPSFERSALAERLRNPRDEATICEVKDGITLFTEGYNCGLHGDDLSFPETMLGMGLEYRTGWAQGFADRPLLKASAEEFAKAMERA